MGNKILITEDKYRKNYPVAPHDYPKKVLGRFFFSIMENVTGEAPIEKNMKSLLSTKNGQG